MPISSVVFGPLGNLIGPTNAVIGGALVLLAYSLFLVARPDLLGTQSCELDEDAPAGPPKG